MKSLAGGSIEEPVGSNGGQVSGWGNGVCRCERAAKMVI